MPPVALTIAGSDPGGGAGLQADLKTFHQLGVYGTSAVTLVTVQNTVRVARVELLAPDLVAGQIHAVLSDLPPRAAKTGALGSLEIVEAVAGALAGAAFPLVVDPVMISKHGAPLLDSEALSGFRELLLPLASLVMPNLHEAAALTGTPVTTVAEMREAARRIAGLGPRAVLIKGGHLAGAAIDVLFSEGIVTEFESARFITRHTHGTGCTYSAATAAYLARGLGIDQAIRAAKTFITEAIRTAPGIGMGSGPVNHWAVTPDPL